jgi:hypothetical protein
MTATIDNLLSRSKAGEAHVVVVKPAFFLFTWTSLYFSHGYGGQTFIRAATQSAAEEALQAIRQVGRNRRASHGTATARHPGASWELGVKQKSAGNASGLRPATLRHRGRAVTNRPPMPGLTSHFPQIAS